MVKLSKEAQVKLSVILTAMTRIGGAKLAAMKVSLAFMQAEKDATPLAVDDPIAQIDLALAEMAEAEEQLRFFRNILRDDRKPFLKRQAITFSYSRDLKLSECDPKEKIAAIVKRWEDQEARSAKASQGEG